MQWRFLKVLDKPLGKLDTKDKEEYQQVCQKGT